MTLEKIVVIYL